MPSLRYFYVFSFLFILFSFSAVGILGSSYVENSIVKPIAISGNKSIATSFTNSIWWKYQKTFAYLPCDKRCPKLDKLKKELDKFIGRIRENSIIGFKIYSHDGVDMLDHKQSFFSINTDTAAEDGFKEAQAGLQSSKLINQYGVNGLEYNVVRSYIPIRPFHSIDQSPENAILEVIYDITPFWHDVATNIAIAIGLVTLIFGGLFGTMLFITQRTEKEFEKQYETTAALETAMASAEKENQEKSQFLANVSHELRTPLNAIIGFSEIVKDEVMGPINNQQYKNYINDIYTSGVHLLSLINDILDYSKAEAGKLTVDLADVDVTKIMKNSLRLVSPRANEAKVKLVSEIPKQHYILHTDGKRLKQVLLNLFSNAVKFTPENGAVTLYAWHNLTENKFVIEVQDTGVGIAAKDISKVMATFGQVENHLSRKYEGTGLGLPLSNKLVELMGGNLDIRSEPNKGTTVIVSLPYIEEKGTGAYDEMEALKTYQKDLEEENDDVGIDDTLAENTSDPQEVIAVPEEHGNLSENKDVEDTEAKEGIEKAFNEENSIFANSQTISEPISNTEEEDKQKSVSTLDILTDGKTPPPDEPAEEPKNDEAQSMPEEQDTPSNMSTLDILSDDTPPIDNSENESIDDEKTDGSVNTMPKLKGEPPMFKEE